MSIHMMMADPPAPEAFETHWHILDKLLNTTAHAFDHLALRDVKGITNNEIEALYAMGYHYYRTGKLDAALRIFKGLVTLDHLEARFWLGLGGVQQRLEAFADATQSYAMASLLDIHDPRPQLAAAECYLKLHQLHEADSALLALERFCPYTEAYHLYRAKGRILRRCLNALRQEEEGATL
ncbi:MAG: SycD/LcrH family type III secretion system chaperone [Kiritimatiellae bacterium]|nr:SycD/LcrH family type III secretion system chaperone [Kiritimatiellia bacterium]